LLFGERGFDATTIEDIVAEVGVSRRTFFRYFPTKEAAFFAEHDERFSEFREALRGARGSSNPWGAVCDAMLAISGRHIEDRERAMAWRRVLDRTPALQAHELQNDALWESAIREELVLGGFDPLESAVRAGALMGASRAVLNTWYSDGGRRDIRVQGRRAISWLESGLATPRRDVALTA
jgi:AcrR family transcriptional regulator